MCGIVGIHFKNPNDKGVKHDKIERFVNELLLGIESRGKDATGLLTVDGNGVPELIKADTKAEQFINWRQPIPKRVRTILGHTRYATQGHPSNLDNDHPVVYGTCYAIHNGHINNDAALFAEHSLERRAEVDSEIIPALFDKFGLDKAHLALQELDGNMATAVVDPARFPNLTVLAKGWSSPVEVWESKHAVVWASTITALQDACEKALGFRPATSKIKTMHAGDILYMDGSSIEALEFEPATYSSKKYSTTSYGNGYSDYSREKVYVPSTGRQSYVGGKLDNECSSCGCKRLWHGTGGNFTGPCQNKIDLSTGGVWLCRCETFVEAKVENFEFCDGCGRKAVLGELKEIGSYFFCVQECVRALFPESPTSEELRKSAEQILTAQVITAEEVANGDEWSNEAWDAREEMLHVESLKWASKRTGLTEEFTDWVLFKAPMELFAADETKYLTNARELAEGAYKDMEKKLRSEVTDMDLVRWQSGDMHRGSEDTETWSLCDTCGGLVNGECEDCVIESCGVVVSMDEWAMRQSELEVS